ncbi:MAG: PIG-L family deacetylase [Bacteroidota bacterium]
MKYFLSGLLACLILGSLQAQRPASASSAQILHGLQKLQVLGSVLYLAAHPDDENTRLIAYLANEKKYRTGYLSLTRGDGGQNLIGDEQGVELGLIRTQELLSARRIDGGEQFFTRAYDFGYSKNPAETFSIWNKDSILADVVWVIRRFRPDIIVTRFPTTGEGGHGHHTGSAILANEAFLAAGDPKRFPEQLKYVSVWQPKRILWNTFNFGGTNTTAPDQLKIDVGGYNPILGKSYGEIAAESRSQHKSQGFGVSAARGESFEYFKTTGGPAPQKDMMEDVSTDWSRIPGGTRVADHIDSLIRTYDPRNPERSVPGLAQLYRILKAMPSSDWISYKTSQVQELLLQCAGIYTEAVATLPAVTGGDTLRFNLSLIARGLVEAMLTNAAFGNTDTTIDRILAENKTTTLYGTIPVSVRAKTTQPYWLRTDMQKGRFVVPDQTEIGIPENGPAYSVQLQLTINGASIKLYVPVVYKLTDPVRGEIYKSLIVRPQIELDADEELTLVSGRKKAKTDLTFRLLANQDLSAQSIRANNRKEVVELGETPALTKGQILRRSKTVAVEEGDYRYQSLTAGGQPGLSEGRLTKIEYDHIPELHYFKPTVQKVRSIDLKTAGKRIGFIPGAGDKIPEALVRMGYEAVQLGERELKKVNLAEFDAIITGVRAYNTHSWLNDSHEKLMTYVKDGGNLIVQYNTSNQIGPVWAKIGPYPFQITRNRVTDELASVDYLQPAHPVFNRPNKLAPSDFENWIQERSVYHGADTTGRFQKLLSIADPGEASDDGSLLIASYGKGWFTYTGLSLFRQLPAGVTGAYRLLANLIALNAKTINE